MADEQNAEEQHHRAEEREEEEIERRRPPQPQTVYETIRREGDEELARPAISLLFSGLAAGLSMGFSFITPAVLYAAIPEAPYKNVLVNFGYSIGFLLVILGRQQLFTENTLTPILPFLKTPTATMFGKVMRLWVLVLSANIVGAVAIAFVCAHSPALHPKVALAFEPIAAAANPGEPFMTTFTRAAMAGWLIALMVWLLPAAESARPYIIILITWLVGAAGFNHIIAGSIEQAYRVWVGTLTPAQFFTTFFAPTLIGNIFGGVVLVAALNYGQIVAESDEKA